MEGVAAGGLACCTPERPAPGKRLLLPLGEPPDDGPRSGVDTKFWLRLSAALEQQQAFTQALLEEQLAGLRKALEERLAELSLELGADANRVSSWRHAVGASNRQHGNQSPGLNEKRPWLSPKPPLHEALTAGANGTGQCDAGNGQCDSESIVEVHNDVEESVRMKPSLTKQGSRLKAVTPPLNYDAKPHTLDPSKLIKDEETTQLRMLDIFVAVLIFLNALCMFMHAQWTGVTSSRDLGLEGTGQGWPGSEDTYMIFDHIFNGTFCLELMVRLFLLRCNFFREVANILDFILVLLTCIGSYIVEPLHLGDSQNLAVVRMFRIFRVLRLLRVVRFAKRFSELRVLANTLTSSAWALCWSMMLLTIIIAGGGIFLSQMLTEYIQDDSANYEMRALVFRYYGDAARATYTLFEATFSGSWPTYARPLVEHVNSWFSVFWVTHNVLITFALLRIIGALFLQETLRASSNDAEMMLMEKMKEKEKFAEKLHRFFTEADTSGDGLISQQELQDCLSHPDVQSWLQVLELQVYEVTALFSILDDNEDGTVSYEEFLSGAMRLKGNARAIDSIAIMHEQYKTRIRMDYIAACIEQLSQNIRSSGHASKERG